jgi:glyoxylase-like metal-dependent hydrolase (beta-lactamase superfamily II)
MGNNAMIFEQIKTGDMGNFAYVVGDEKIGEGFVVDPSFDPGKVLQVAKKHGLKIKYLLNTHEHFDHAMGNDYILAETGATLMKTDFNLGDLKVKIIATPGHSSDSVCILVDNKLMTGDTLFVGGVGRVWSEEDAHKEYESLGKLMALPDETEVYPGHDYGKTPSSTIGHEKKANPFLRHNSFKAFLRLRSIG